MAFVCALSGVVPSEPVLSTKSGHVFEKSLINKYLENSGNVDPITNEPLSADDLIDIKNSPITKPRITANNSIPGMLKNMQDEYNALCLNNFQLRKQLKTTRQELSNHLYHNQASIEVIARLLKESKAARDAYETLNPAQNLHQPKHAKLESVTGPKNSPENSNVHSVGTNDNTQGDINQENIAPNETNAAQKQPKTDINFDADVKPRIQTMSKQIATKRSSRSKIMPETLASDSQINKFRLQKAVMGIHSPSVPGIQVLKLISDKDMVLTGGRDGHVKLFSIQNDRICANFKAHSKALTGLNILSMADRNVISSSIDGTVSVMNFKTFEAVESPDTEALKPQHNFIPLKGSPIVGQDVDILKENLLLAAPTKWTFLNVETQKPLLEDFEPSPKHENAVTLENFKYTTAKMHLDGRIFALGMATGTISIWSLQDKVQACYFDEHKDPVQALAFSENGYHMASASLENTVKIWDLRNLKCTETIKPKGLNRLKSVAYDLSGFRLAVGGENSLNVYSTTNWQPILQLDPNSHKRAVKDMCFGQDARQIYTVSNDRGLRMFHA